MSTVLHNNNNNQTPKTYSIIIKNYYYYQYYTVGYYCMINDYHLLYHITVLYDPDSSVLYSTK